jgi:hypothetical protein
MTAWPCTPPTQIIKFANVCSCLITNNDETAYREEVRALGVWCQENNLSLNVNKTKETIVNLRGSIPHPHRRDSNGKF